VTRLCGWGEATRGGGAAGEDRLRRFAAPGTTGVSGEVPRPQHAAAVMRASKRTDIWTRASWDGR